jgi:hypothetical protein
MTDKGWYPSRSIEYKIEHNKKMREKYNSATEEEKALRKKKRREYEKRIVDSFSPEKLEVYKKNQRKRWEKYQLNSSKEQKEKRYEKTLSRNLSNYHSLYPIDKAKRLEKFRIDSKQRRDKLRHLVISHYSTGKLCCMNPKCEVPGGAKNFLALCIDHVNGGGRKHAQELGGHVYEWIVKNNYPQGFQVLCQNCNIIKKIENKEDFRK